MKVRPLGSPHRFLPRTSPVSRLSGLLNGRIWKEEGSLASTFQWPLTVSSIKSKSLLGPCGSGG